MVRWLAIYSDDNGRPRAAIIMPSNPSDFPFGVSAESLGLDDYNDGACLTLVEVPGASVTEIGEFRPLVVDIDADREVVIQFIDV